MKDSIDNHNEEFDKLVGNLSDAIHQVDDPVALATMLFSIAEEKKSSNLVVRDINGKFDILIEKLNTISKELKELNETLSSTYSKQRLDLSDRDKEIYEFVNEKGKVCADEVQEKFEYKGRNAASARLSNLFKHGIVEKTYVGKKVYYAKKF